MSPKMIRQFWMLLEAVQNNIPLTLDDTSLAQWLIRQITAERPIDSRESAILSEYICSRLPLIRDMVQGY
jgi:hypothetical protein